MRRLSMTSIFRELLPLHGFQGIIVGRFINLEISGKHIFEDLESKEGVKVFCHTRQF